MKTLLIAHRANTLEKIHYFFTFPVGGLEMDLHLSKDKKVIITHDSVNPDGSLIEENEAGNILQLEKILKDGYIPHDKRLLMDIKSAGTEIMIKTVDLLKKYSYENVEIFTSDAGQIMFLLQNYPEYDRGLYLRPSYFEPWMNEKYLLYALKEYSLSLQLSVLHIPYIKCTQSIVDELASVGVTVTCNIPSIEAIDTIFDLGCKQVSTDYIEDAIQKFQ